MLYAIVALLVIILDQWVKFWVSGFIPLDSTGVPFIQNLISLVNVHNDGAAFSLFSGGNARIYFIIATAVFTIAVILALATKFVSGPVARWGLVLMTAGGLSNCIDRVIYGYVQDMFKFEPLPSFPVFNVADIAITVFCFLFILALIFEKDRRKEAEPVEDEFEDEDPEEDEEEEEPRPSRKKAARPARRAARRELEDDEDEEEEEEPAPAPRREKAAPTRERARREKAEEEEPVRQERPARRAAAVREEPVRPAKAAAPAQEDPFAEWERRTAQPAREPVRPAAPAQTPQQAKPAAPARKDDEFSLDDILAEFK